VKYWRRLVKFTIVNKEVIPDGLPEGMYCCRVVSATWDEIVIEFIRREHVMGDCLIQLVKKSIEYQAKYRDSYGMEGFIKLAYNEPQTLTRVVWEAALRLADDYDYVNYEFLGVEEVVKE
jgi:hypothetical protein